MEKGDCCGVVLFSFLVKLASPIGILIENFLEGLIKLVSIIDYIICYISYIDVVVDECK